MRVFVTGATGFVGGWLQRELVAAGHEVVAAPGANELDITDRAGLARWFAGGLDALVHLAGMAFGPDAQSDPAEAFRVNVAGTVAIFEALRELGVRPPVLVAGSSDVYGAPRPEDLPLRESARVNPRQPYAVSKAAQEGIAVEAGVRWGFPVVVTRSFNHTGPGQRSVFVVPAMARRVLSVKRGEVLVIPAGNVDVRRDIGDVRDVVRAYRLLLEKAAVGRLGSNPIVINVATGRAVTIRSLIEQLCALAGIAATVQVDPALVRADDPPEIRGDASLLTDITGWRPEIPLEQTLSDLLGEGQTDSPAQPVATGRRLQP
jgi:GDP-4-dehydro-6-deoxy-D-mannose reductase